MREVYKLKHVDAVKAFLNEKKFKWIGIFLVGSQNYGVNLDEDLYHSDEDYVVLILPTMEDLIRRNEFKSKEYSFDFGHISVMDVRLFAKTLLKVNPHTLEILGCPEGHYELNPEYDTTYNESLYQSMREDLDTIIRQNQNDYLWAVWGLGNSMNKKLQNSEGKNGKMLQHILRMKLLMEDVVVKRIPFVTAIQSRQHQLQKDYKRNVTLHKYPYPEMMYLGN